MYFYVYFSPFNMSNMFNFFNDNKQTSLLSIGYHISKVKEHKLY